MLSGWPLSIAPLNAVASVTGLLAGSDPSVAPWAATAIAAACRPEAGQECATRVQLVPVQ
jgi:hypothetical protein